MITDMFGQILIYGLVTGTQVLLLALALYCVQLVSKVINLALGGIAASVAYAFYFAFTLQHWPVAVSILFALAIAVLLGAVNYYLNEPITKKQQYLMALLVSFALGFGLEAIIAMLFGSDGKSLVVGIVNSLQFGAYEIPLSGVYILGAGAFVGLCATGLYFWTPIGRLLRAISENYFAALSLGINQPQVRLVAYCVAAIIAGLVGTLVGFNTALLPTMGFNLIAMAFMALLVGGVNDLRGTIVAAYLIGFIPELVIGLVSGVSAQWRLALVFVIAASCLIVRPQGLFNRTQRLS